MRKSRSDMAVIGACREILDRGHGKPLQALRHEGEIRVTHEQWLERMEKVIETVEAQKTDEMNGIIRRIGDA
jgi:hypothetical protein